MPISRKVNKETQPPILPVNEKQIDALIEKGGSVTKENRKTPPSDKNENHPLLLNIPKQLLDIIDEELGMLPAYYHKKRTPYILQAIEEKIQRDRKKRK